MFVDMRGSTKMAEKRLPFDTVFIVNRFLGAVSQAVLESGGMPNQFVGDGMLALFGLSVSRREACRQALRAAAQIAANVDELNKFLSHDLREPIRFGIGIHGGEVIVGDIGYRDHMVFTALGDPVNVAARLQDMTKALSCEVVVSDEVRNTAGLSRGRVAAAGSADPRPQRADDRAHRRGCANAGGAGRRRRRCRGLTWTAWCPALARPGFFTSRYCAATAWARYKPGSDRRTGRVQDRRIPDRDLLNRGPAALVRPCRARGCEMLRIRQKLELKLPQIPRKLRFVRH